MRAVLLVLPLLLLSCGDKDSDGDATGTSPSSDGGASTWLDEQGDGGTPDGGTADGGTADGGSADGGTTGPIDADGDGYDSSVDCDDSNDAVHPGATDGCDELDNDCDEEIDEDPDLTWYDDSDGDGAGNPESGTVSCDAPLNTVDNADDCDDHDYDAFPGNTEVCDEVDNDCDGDVDAEDDDVDACEVSMSGTWTMTVQGNSMNVYLDERCTGELSGSLDDAASSTATLRATMSGDCTDPKFGTEFLLSFDGTSDGASARGDIGWSGDVFSGWSGTWSDDGTTLTAEFSTTLYFVSFFTYGYADGSFELTVD